MAEWQHLIAHYDGLPRDEKRPWLKGAGISTITLAQKKTELKKLGLKPVKSAHPLTRHGQPGKLFATAAVAELKKPVPRAWKKNPFKFAVDTVQQEEIAFLRYLVKHARKQGFLAEILSIDGE